MPITDGEVVILIHEDRRAIWDGGTIQLGVVGLTQSYDVDLERNVRMERKNPKFHQTHRSISDLDLELGVLLADYWKLDPDVASLGPPEQTFLEIYNFNFSYKDKIIFNYLVNEGKC